jgi:transposase
MEPWDAFFSDNRRTPGPLPAATVQPRAPSRLQVDPENVSSGLLRLVLTLVELLRELLERQALRRIEGGSLTEEEIERLGLTFLRLAEEMQRLKRQFGLTDDDLNLDLGPLGRLR